MNLVKMETDTAWVQLEEKGSFEIKNELSFFNLTSNLIYLATWTHTEVNPVHLCNKRIAA